MRYFKSKILGEYSTEDFIRIAKEMVNIYHGIQYYDTTTADAPLLKKPIAGYLSFEHGTIKSTITPARGYIYIHTTNDLWSLNITPDKFKQEFESKFMEYNLWGNRIYSATFDQAPALVYSYALRSVDEKAQDVFVINTTDIFHSKTYTHGMCWFYTAKHEAFKYAIPGEARKPYYIMASASTIVLDLSHSIRLDDGYGSLSMPQLPSDKITILKKHIILSKRAGIDTYLYAKQRDIDILPPYKPLSIKITTTEEKTPKFKYVRPTSLMNEYNPWVTEFAQTEIPDICYICHTKLWGSNYRFIAKQTQAHRAPPKPVQRRRRRGDDPEPEPKSKGRPAANKAANDKKKAAAVHEMQLVGRPNAAIICRFCVHYNNFRDKFENDTNLKAIEIVNSTVSRNMIINTTIKDDLEKKILHRIQKNIENKTMKFYDSSPDLKNNSLWHIDGDDGTLLGLPHYVDIGDCAGDLLEYAIKLNNHIMVFKYTRIE